jgi:hypothetical protein
MTYRKRKSLRTTILALATAAILVPAAQAHTDFGTTSASGYTPQALKAMGERYEKMADAYQASQATRPDDRGGAQGVGQATVTSDYVDRQLANILAESTPVSHVDDRAGVRGPGPGPVETPTVVTTHDGFDWTDAGIGASAMLFVAALIAAAMLARRRPSIAV